MKKSDIMKFRPEAEQAGKNNRLIEKKRRGYV